MNTTDSGHIDAMNLSQSPFLQNLVITLKKENLLTSIIEKHANEKNEAREMTFASHTATTANNLLENATFLKVLSLAAAKVLADNIGFVKLMNQKVNEKTTVLEKQLEQQCQYTRRNCLIVHGIKEELKEDTNEIMKTFFWNELGIEVYDLDIDRTHRLRTLQN